MKTGQQLDVILNYSSLYKLNPETARAAMLEVFKQTNNISKTARMFSTTRKVVQLAMKKNTEGNLSDKSHAANLVHNKTVGSIEQKAIAIKNSTHFGYRRVAKELRDTHGLNIKDFTVRNILKRARVKDLIKGEKVINGSGKKVAFYDWYSAAPFEIIQTDLKDILDKKALALGNTLRTYDWLKPYQPIDLTFTILTQMLQTPEAGVRIYPTHN